MEPLKNHTLIYDNECPMCNIYSKGFIKSGMLGESGREAFTDLSLENKSVNDFHRAKNEIALVDHEKNKVIYGLDSLLLIIGNSFPLLAKITRIKPFYWFFKKLYSFVSYNRKQIIPSKKDNTEEACIPDFNLKYRLAYLAFVVIFSGYILSIFNKIRIRFNSEFLERIYNLYRTNRLADCIFKILFKKQNMELPRKYDDRFSDRNFTFNSRFIFKSKSGFFNNLFWNRCIHHVSGTHSKM